MYHNLKFQETCVVGVQTKNDVINTVNQSLCILLHLLHIFSLTLLLPSREIKENYDFLILYIK